MATNTPLISEKREDTYELELSRMGEKIKSTFVELIDCLKARESELLRELDNILSSYLSYRRESERVSEKKIALETIKNSHEIQIPNSPVKSVHEDCIARVNTELKSIETPAEPKIVTFDCDQMFSQLRKLGKLVQKVQSETGYKSKKQPLVSVCDRGSGDQQLNYPLGITVDDKTGNIYVADQANKCVKVFDSSAKYLFKFGDTEGEGIMISSRGVAICGDRILISQLDDCILNYRLNGMFISRIGRKGKRELEFDDPRGLAIDESNGDIYICDRCNDRVQILNRDFSFKAEFRNGVLNHPRDVKLSKHLVFVLDESNPCLHLFNYNYSLQKSVITRGYGMDVIDPCYNSLLTKLIMF